MKMSKDDQSKSSPSPKPGLPFDPSHLLGMHSLAASGLPYAPLASHFPHPYPFLAQPTAFPGLFGGLGALPNPLHAAALSHSLAAASLYGLPKYPSELGSPPPTSSSPSSSSKRGKTSRSTPTPSSSPSPSGQQRVSSSTPLSLLSPSSHSSLPSHFDPAAIAPYLSSWALNGSAYHLPSLSSPLANETSKRVLATPSTSSSSTSRQGKKSSTSSSNSSSKIPQAHQHESSSLLPSSSSSSLQNPLNPSLEPNKYSLEKSALGENFPFDPRALITPYHLSPELAYLSQSLFMHRPDLDLSSSLLAASASASPAASSSASSNLPSTSESYSHKSSQLAASFSGKRSQSPSVSSRKGDRVKGERSKGEKRSRETPEPVNDSKSKLTNGTPKVSDVDNHPKSNHSRADSVERSRTEALINEDSSPFDPTNPLHFMDDNRRKQIADQIRKRVGLSESSMASLFTEHGIKHSEWLEQWASQRDSHGKEKEKEEPSASASSSRTRDWNGEKEAERRHSETNSLERQLQLHQEQLLELQRKYGMKEQNDSHLTTSDSNSLSQYTDRGRQSGASKDIKDDSMEGDASTDSEGDKGSKRSGEGNEEASPSKKRCYQTNERELVIPLEHGWNRQTIISGMGRRGIVGEVLYFGPCGKKMKTIPDVMRYLERNPNSDLGRENFSFNTKVNVGHFFEVRAGQSNPVPLTDTEVLERIEMSRGKRARMQMLARKKREKAAREQALARQIMENKLKRRMELQEMSRRAAEMRFEKKLEKQRQKELEKKLKEDKALEKQKEKEQHKLLKQQERFRLQEQLRKEREMRAQQIIEARNRRQQELEEMRLADALKRNKEKEMKRQQLIILKEQERERRRQHLLLVKALEQRKKQEEKQTKERLREEKLNEKMKLREMRLHQRKVEMEVAAELKKPVEDMELKNRKTLPELPRLKSRLSGKPIADCMMVVEFLNNFGIALNLEKSSLPTLESLERGLMCDSEDDVEELMSLVMHLLRFALDDVGVPNPKEAVTKLNQKITEMEMTDTTMSEILRIFIKARGEKEMSEWLTEHPLEALNPTQKAAVLGFLCNELLTSKVITSEIDKHMESINNLRRDKWIVEGQLRQLRVFQAKKFNKIHKSTDRRANPVNSSFVSVTQDEDTVSSSKMGSDEEEEDKEDEEGSGNESDGGSSVNTQVSSSSSMPFEPVDESMSREESDKRIEGLRKQHAAYRQKVFRSCLRLRAINIGQDRYKRTYWILPLTGGIYVEGMESGEPEDFVEENKMKIKEELKMEREISQEKAESNSIEKNVEDIGNSEGTDRVDDGVTLKTDECIGQKLKSEDAGEEMIDGNAYGDENLIESMEDSIDNEDEPEVDEPEDMEVSNITGNYHDLSQRDNDNQNGSSTNQEELRESMEEDPDSALNTYAKENKINHQVDHSNGDGKEAGGTLYNMLKESAGKRVANSSLINAPSINGHLEDCTTDKKNQNSGAQVTSHDNHFHLLSSPVSPDPNSQSSKIANRFVEKPVSHNDTNLISEKYDAERKSNITDADMTEIDNDPHEHEANHADAKNCTELSVHCVPESDDQAMQKTGVCVKAIDDIGGLVSIDLSQKNVPAIENGTETIDLEMSDEKSLHIPKESTADCGERSVALDLHQPASVGAVTHSQEIKGSVSDILKVPKVGHAQRDSLFTLLNHSITNSYLDENKATTSGVTVALEAKPAATSSSQPPSVSSSQSILSSSLLFSSYSSKPSSRAEEKSKSHTSTPVTSSPLPSSVLVCPSPFLSPKARLPASHYGKHTNGPDEGALNLMAISPVPLPAHSKSLDRNSLPPHHPAAQFKSPRDQTPPAAHTKQTSKPMPPNFQEVGHSPSPSHHPHPPFIPGLSHHPYGGQPSASQTLSSLASIVSPPPAHQHPPSTTATSYLMSSPKLPTFTTSLTSTAATSLSSSSALSSSSSSSASKSLPSFSLIDMVLKNEQHYSSSQLLHHAASQVLRSGDNVTPVSSLTTPASPAASSATSIDLTTTNCLSSDMISTPSTMTTSSLQAALPQDSSNPVSSLSLESTDEPDKEGTPQEMWFSLLPRTPCDELSLTRPSLSASNQPPQSSATYSSSSSSPISSILNSSLSLESLMPLLQSHPSLLSQESLRTSLQLLASPSPSPTPSSSAGDMSCDFKVPQPPLDSSLNYDPWDILRAAQGEKQQIPKNKRHGWWKIYDLAMLKATMTATMNRGIREKNLQRAIHRYLDYARIHATFDSSIGEKDPSDSASECKGDKKKKKQQESKKDKEEPKSDSGTPTKKDEEGRSSQSTDNTSDSDAGKVKQEVVKEEVATDLASGEEQMKVDSNNVGSAPSNGGDEEQEEEKEDFVALDDGDTWSVPIMHEIEVATLEEVEALEDRIYHASLQAKYGWKSCKESNYTLVDHSVIELKEEECYPIEAAKARLLQLELNIERRYLKPPLARSVPLNISTTSDKQDGEGEEKEDVCPGLALWRQAVENAQSPAQLSLCIQMLVKSISWEKSIMRVICQNCRKDDNEAELLLCDGCDKGFHTYCFKPKMETIPDGDWYCFECVSKASGTPHCGLCGAKGGKIVSCSKCPRCVHLECMDPPMPRMPKRWQCINCAADKGNSKRSRKRKESLPTVQRITITKLVIKEEPQDDVDFPVVASTLPLVAKSFKQAPSPSPKMEQSPRKAESATSQSPGESGNSSSPSEKKKRKRKEKDPENTPHTTSPPSKKKEKRERKDRKSKTESKEQGDEERETDDKNVEKDRVKEQAIWAKLLTEMEKHEEGWPFLKPVSQKQFPSYKKYIKTPMDFSTVKTKLKNKGYKHRQEFATDIRLIFDNCETFNEDDSEVGKAGHSMRSFFEERWISVFPDEAA